MNVLLYSPVASDESFSKAGFYRDDIEAIRTFASSVVAERSLWRVLVADYAGIVAYFYSWSLLCTVIGRVRGIPVVITGGADQIAPEVVSGWSLYRNRVVAFLCIVLCTKIMSVSTTDTNNLKALCLGIGRLERKIVLSQHVIQCSDTKRSLQPLAIISDRKVRVLTIGWMGTIANAVRKGLDKCVLLVAGMKRIGVDVELTIIGDGMPGREYVEDLALSEGIADSVCFRGYLSEREKEVFIRSADGYLQLSSYEGYGLAAAEAFCSGLPVVHSGVGGLIDSVGAHGYVLCRDKINALSRKEILNVLRFMSEYRPPLEAIANLKANSSYAARARAIREHLGFC